MKRVVFILMILLLISSWYIVIANANQNHDNYNAYLEKANNYLKKKIYIDAIDCYKKAINIFPDNIGNKITLALIYKDAKMYGSFENYCKNLANEYKNNEEIVIILGEYYVEIDQSQKAIAWYRDNLVKNHDSKQISEKLKELKSAFSLDYDSYDYISIFHNGYATYKKNNKFGIMDDRGNIIVNATYDDAGVFDNNKLKLAPVLCDGEYFYIDLEGNKRLAFDKKYDYVGNFSDNGLAVFKNNNKYGYVDKELNEYKLNYVYASTFCHSGVAFVKKNNKWFLINEKFEAINDSRYEDVKIDDLGYFVHSNIIFAKKDGKYMMLDSNGNEITKPFLDDADYFISLNEPAAVKINGKWGFIDAMGNIVIKPKYENAFSFSCGLAPVLINDLWGFINIQDKVVISPQFEMAKSFNRCGVAPVLKLKWQLISLEYYK